MNRRQFASTLLGLGFTLSSRGKRCFSGVPAQTAPTRWGSSSPSPPPLEHQYRGYIVDHHSPDPPAITYDRFDPEQWLRLYEAADLDHDWVFCKGHHGEAYYPTEVGHMHPGLKVDFVDVMSRGLRRMGMAFHAYYCIGYDDWAAIQHPDWAIIDESRNPLRYLAAHFAQWHWVCVNTPYRQYVIKQLTEIVRAYSPDGIFLDILGQPLCYCKYCSQLYIDSYGHAIPRGHLQGQAWREVQDFLYETTQYQFVREVISLVRGLGSRAALTVNGGHLDFRKELLDLVDYTYAEPWAGDYLSAMFARGTGKIPEIGPGLVAKVYDPSPVSVFKAETAMIAAQNCRVFLFSETMAQDGSLDSLWFREMGAAYKEIHEIQPYLIDRSPVPCVAVVFGDRTHFSEHLVWSMPQYQPEGGFDHQSSLRGAMESAIRSQYPSDVLPQWQLSSSGLGNYQCVILPEVVILADEEAAALTKFVEAGGLLVVTGVTGTKRHEESERPNFALADIMGCDFVRVEKKYLNNSWGSYLNRDKDPFWERVPDATLVVEAPLVVIKPRPMTRVLATHILPAVVWSQDRDNDEGAWVNWDPPPPGHPSGYPAITVSRYGRGEVLYAGFDLFGMITRDFSWPSEFLLEFLDVHLARPVMRVKSAYRPASLGTTYYKRNSEAIVIVHQVNRAVSELHGEVLALDGGTLFVRNGYFRARSCSQILPEKREIEVKTNGEFQTIELPQVRMHNVFLIRE
jgi:hypothetical protein